MSQFQPPQKVVTTAGGKGEATPFFYNFLVQLIRALNLFWDGTNLKLNGNVILTTAGNKLSIKEGTNASMGLATLVAGTVTVATTLVTANTRIFLSDQGGGVAANIGALYVSARVAGTSFSITSNNAADTSNVAWLLIEPS